VQKLYLGVGELGKPNAVLSTEEARRIMVTAGAELDDWQPPPIIVESTREPEPPQLPPAAPTQLPPAEGDDDVIPDE